MKLVPQNSRGFTLIELAVVITAIGIMAAIAIFGYLRVVEQAHFDATQKKLENIQKAISGDPSILSAGARTSFGFFGDMGNAPGSLADLVTNPGATVYNPSTGMGWNGPYLDTAFGDYQNDGWGAPFIYASSAAGITVSSSSGATPQSVSIQATDLAGTVQVYVHNAAGPVLGAVVTIDRPNNGASVATLPSTQANGYYSFANIPFGKRVVWVNGQRCNNSVGTVTVTSTSNIIDCRL